MQMVDVRRFNLCMCAVPHVNVISAPTKYIYA